MLMYHVSILGISVIRYQIQFHFLFLQTSVLWSVKKTNPLSRLTGGCSLPAVFARLFIVSLTIFGKKLKLSIRKKIIKLFRPNQPDFTNFSFSQYFC